MKQFTVDKINGVELSPSINIGLDPEKIVRLWSNAGTTAGPVSVEYEVTKSRRKTIVLYEIDVALLATVVALIGDTMAINVDKDNASFPVTLNTAYIKEMREQTIRFQGADNSGVEIELNIGAQLTEKVQALSTDLDTLIGAAIT